MTEIDLQKSRFQIYQDKAELWRWRLLANNSQIIAQGKSYANKQRAEHGVLVVVRCIVGGEPEWLGPAEIAKGAKAVRKTDTRLGPFSPLVVVQYL